MSDIHRYRDLILHLAARDLKVRYRRSVIGFLWTMLQPLILMLVFQAVFSALFRFDIPNYPVYALVGVLFWNFFSQTVVASMNSLRGNAQLMQKLPVPSAVFPLATVLSGLVNLALALVPLFLVLLVTGHPLSGALFFLPVAIAIGAAFTLGAGLLLSPLAVFFSDTVELVSVVLMMLMYLTPVFYPMSILPASVRWVVEANPVRLMLESFREPIYHGQLPSWSTLGLSLGAALLSLGLGVEVFRRSSDRIPYYV